MRIEEDNPGCGPPPPGRDERARPETTTLSRRTPAGSWPNGTSTRSAPLAAAGFPKHPARRPEVAALPHQYTGAEVLGRPVRSAVDSRSGPVGRRLEPPHPPRLNLDRGADSTSQGSQMRAPSKPAIKLDHDDDLACARCSSPLFMTKRARARLRPRERPNRRPADSPTRPRRSRHIPRPRGAEDSTRVRYVRRVHAAPATYRSGPRLQIALFAAGTRHRRPRSQRATPSARTHRRRSRRRSSRTTGTGDCASNAAAAET